MAGNNALGERFGEIFDWIAARKRAEGRSIRVGAVSLFADGMATRAILLDQHAALVRQVLLGGTSRHRRKEKKQRGRAESRQAPSAVKCNSAWHVFLPRGDSASVSRAIPAHGRRGPNERPRDAK